MKTEKKKNKWITIPAGWYGLIFLTGVILFAVSQKCVCVTSTFLRVAENLSYGVVASDIVAIILDIQNTKIKRNEDELIFKRLINSLHDAVEDIRFDITTAVYDSGIKTQYETYVFADWVHLLFSGQVANEEERNKEIKYYCGTVKTLGDIAKDRKASIMASFIPNSCLSDDFIEDLDKLIRACNQVKVYQKRLNYSKCEEILADQLPEIIGRIDDASKDNFKKPYNENDFN